MADPEQWKYEWGRLLPSAFEVAISNPMDNSVVFRRWMGWNSSTPPDTWATVDAPADVRELGMFAMMTADEAQQGAQSAQQQLETVAE